MCQNRLKESLRVGQTPISAIKMRPIKILFFCSSRLALPALQELAFFNLVAAVIIPGHCDEMIENTRFILTDTDIPVLSVDKSSYIKQVKEIIENYHPTLGLIITFSYLIPSSVYHLLPDGFYNVHPGPLPAYRGADPVFQQIKNREKQAGVTIHKLAEGFDNGPVVIKEMIRLELTDTYGMLTTKLAQVAARLTMVLFKLISYEVSVPSKTQDESKAIYYKRQQAKDVSINWELMDADNVIALINACNPWNKGASTKINNKIIRFLEAVQLTGEVADNNVLPGTIIAFDDKGMIVSTIYNQLIRVCIIHADEGFLNAKRLNEIGVLTGNRFENI